MSIAIVNYSANGRAPSEHVVPNSKKLLQDNNHLPHVITKIIVGSGQASVPAAFALHASPHYSKRPTNNMACAKTLGPQSHRFY